MKSINNSIHVLIAKYLENKATTDESLKVLNALSSSEELRGIFCMAVAGMSWFQGACPKSLQQIE